MAEQPPQFHSKPEAAMWDSHERRISRLEEGYQTMSRVVDRIESEIHRNNELTERVARDTEEIRDVVKGAKVFGKIAGWAGGVTSLVVTVYALIGIFGSGS